MEVEVTVHHYFHTVSETDHTKTELIIQLLLDLGANVSALSDAVDAALASEAGEDEQHAAAITALNAVVVDLQGQLAAAGEQLTTALANDAADAQTIADAQAALAAQQADTQAQIDRLAEAFPGVVVEVPVDPVEPPAEVPPVDSPPVDSGANPADPGNGLNDL